MLSGSCPKIVNPNLEIDAAALEYQQNLAKTIGQIKATMPTDKFYDGRFVKAMLQQLGPYKRT